MGCGRPLQSQGSQRREKAEERACRGFIKLWQLRLAGHQIGGPRPVIMYTFWVDHRSLAPDVVSNTVQRELRGGGRHSRLEGAQGTRAPQNFGLSQLAKLPTLESMALRDSVWRATPRSIEEAELAEPTREKESSAEAALANELPTVASMALRDCSWHSSGHRIWPSAAGSPVRP